MRFTTSQLFPQAQNSAMPVINFSGSPIDVLTLMLLGYFLSTAFNRYILKWICRKPGVCIQVTDKVK